MRCLECQLRFTNQSSVDVRLKKNPNISESFQAERVQLTDNNGISVAGIDFLSRLNLMTFKGQCHYINGRVQRSVVGQHNGT